MAAAPAQSPPARDLSLEAQIPPVPVAVPAPDPDQAEQQGQVLDEQVFAAASLPEEMNTSFSGRPAWLVLGDHFKEHGPANIRAGELMGRGVATTIMGTELFENLRDGYVALVHGAFATREEAQARAEQLKAQGLSVYVKHSGASMLILDGDAPQRLIHLHGKATRSGSFGSARSRMYVPVSISIGVDTYETTTDAEGRYQMWVVVQGDAKAELGIPETEETPRGCSGFYPTWAEVKLPRIAGASVMVDELHQWPDCCPE